MADEAVTPAPPEAKKQVSSNPAPILVKITEVILAIFIIGLMVDPLNSYENIFLRTRLKLDDASIIYIAVAGYLIINMLFIIGYALGDRIPKRTAILFSAMGCLLHIVAASVMVDNWRNVMFSHYANTAIHASKQYNDMLISGAVFAFINAAVFAVDVVISAKFT